MNLLAAYFTKLYEKTLKDTELTYNNKVSRDIAINGYQSASRNVNTVIVRSRKSERKLVIGIRSMVCVPVT